VIKKLFGNQAYQIPVTSNKSMLGHMLRSSVGVEAIALIKTLMEGIIPQTINLSEPDSDCDLDYVSKTARREMVKIGLSNSIGFGHNSAIVLKK
jgi:3-oxoacyl-[acyl-carrier-protein] synthase II